MSRQLTEIINASQLENETAVALRTSFSPFYEKLNEWEDKVFTINVTSIDQVESMKLARQTRIEIKAIRVQCEQMRKALKADSLKKGQTIDAIYNRIEAGLKPLETYLESQEKFAEIYEANRIEALKQERLELLKPYNVPVNTAILGTMNAPTWETFFLEVQVTHAERLEKERIEQEERFKREIEEAQEKERLRLEIERLNAESVERERVLYVERLERERLEAIEKAKAIETARIERELKEKEANELRIKLAEEKAKLDAILLENKRIEEENAKIVQNIKEAERQASLAPDKEKLITFGRAIAQLEAPTLSSVESKAILQNVFILLGKVDKYIQEQTEKM